MCGIVGFSGVKDTDRLISLLSSIEHRGRDERVVYAKNGVNLGMNRLAIVDLTPGMYPVRYKNYVMVYNGEIYNFKSLRRALERRSVSFTTESDAEVILPLFDAYGYRAFSMLEGMFAICIVDTGKNKLILARDKSGEKPLYYRHNKAEFLFASELKVLLQSGEQNTLNAPLLNEYLRQGFMFAPNTMIKEAKKIPPSGYIIYDLKKKSVTHGTYWTPQINTKPPDFVESEDAVIRKIDSLLHKAVSSRLVSDVPVGCFLSGGIDSSLIALFASQRYHTLRTYSVAFPECEQEDESRFSRFIAARIKSEHTEVMCTATAVGELLPRIGTLVDDPIADPAVLPTLLLSREARKQVKVVLTGEGADELFGGYQRYQRELYINMARRILQSRKNVMSAVRWLFPTRFNSLKLPFVQGYSAQKIWNTRELNQFLMRSQSDMIPHDYMRMFGVSDPLLAMQMTDYRGYMAEQLLMKIDKSTMASNLEARAPYLDYNLMRFAFSLPRQYKLRMHTGKYILKQVAKKYLPHTFVHRKKHGFELPLSVWFRGELREHVEKSARQIEQYADVFHPDMYKRIVDEHLCGSRDNSDKIWSMIVLLSWMDAHHISHEYN